MARPKEFEPKEALEKAMHQFWAKGYHDTSIRDLVKATGVNYYGLYEVFDSKHGLFLAALDHYRDTVTTAFVEALRRSGPVRPVIARAFDQLLESTRTPDGYAGCLMGNTAVELATGDSLAAEKVEAHMKRLRNAFKARLLEGRKSGEVAKDADIGALAEFLAATTFSVGTLTRSGCNAAYVKRYLRTALSVLG